MRLISMLTKCNALATLLAASVTSIAVVGNAETTAEKIARAITAAPADITDNATIMDVDLTILREGTNSWICLPGIYIYYGNKNPMCNNDTWMRMMAANKAIEDFSTDIVGISYMLAGEYMGNNTNPMANVPDNGGMWVPAGAQMMLLFPNMEVVSNLPRDSSVGGPWVMWDNTPYAHVMIPIVPK
jgi:hypothetical protein